jgi:hypothetical protein
MPAIDPIRTRDPLESALDRIQELKARTTEKLDEAMSVVSRNLGREEAAEAENGVRDLGLALSGQDAAVHRLDHSRVLDLISDPFEDA